MRSENLDLQSSVFGAGDCSICLCPDLSSGFDVIIPVVLLVISQYAAVQVLMIDM